MQIEQRGRVGRSDFRGKDITGKPYRFEMNRKSPVRDTLSQKSCNRKGLSV